MPFKKDIFFKAIAALKQKQQKPETEPVQKTLKERARERLRKIGVNREGGAKFGDSIDPIQKLYQPSFFVKSQKPEPFDEQRQSKYISDANNWLLVHATNYMPENNTIQTTAMARNWSAPRSTVHFTLNHIVLSHMGGNWDDRPVIILSPFKDTVEENGNPVGFALVDTYFSPDADKGLKLPKSARIIHPGNVPDGLLFQIKPNETIYKTDNYTDDEIQEILTLMTPKDRQIYTDMLNGVLDEQQLYDVFQTDYTGKIKKSYNASKDKKAFLSGIMAETRYKMLTHFVRQMATHMTIERMGYKEITQTYEGEDVSRQVADTAEEIGLKGITVSNKGHSNSIYAIMEDIYEGCQFFVQKLIKEKEIESLKEVFENCAGYASIFMKMFTNSIISKRPISSESIYQIFVQRFKEYYESYYQENYGEYSGIQKFDKNLDTTIKRYCEYQAKELNAIISEYEKIPAFKEMIQQIYLRSNSSRNASRDR